MKKIISVAIMFFGLYIVKADGQFVRVRPGFSVGVSIGAPGPAPYAGGVWIAPEWTWREGRYVEAPGYWARPGGRHHHSWIPGHWRYTRRGYRWIPGRWR